MLALAAASPARAAHVGPIAAADSAAAPGDSLIDMPWPPVAPPAQALPLIETRPSTGRTVPARHDLTGFDAPRWVMARSLLVPGWGQLHNGSWIKAIGVAAGEGLLVTRMRGDQRALDDLDREIAAARGENDQAREVVAVEAYNRRLDDLVGRQWLFAALLSYSLLDAYIDAHFRDFEIEFKHDPALPEGAPKGSVLAGETRIALRWWF